MKNFKSIVLGLMLAIIAISPVSRVHAEVKAEKTVKASATVKIADRKAKADQEINRRIEALNQLVTRINQMKKIPTEGKATLVAKAQENITLLTTLKAKIDADTDLATLKTDVKSIAKSYRIFMLILPQIHTVAAADRISTTVDQLNIVASKLNIRITNAGDKGTTFATQLADMNAKITEAQTKAQDAINLVMTLVPDNGVEAQMESNKKALEDAKAMIETASADVRDASSIAKTINTGLKAVGY
jgi:hypothetical protein